MHEHGMTTAHKQRNERRLERGVDVTIRIQVPLKMVHANEGKSRREA